MKNLLILFFIFSLIGCCDVTEYSKSYWTKLWFGKKLLFPHNSLFLVKNKDTLNCFGDKSNFKIVNYVSSINKMHGDKELELWKTFIYKIASFKENKVSVLFYFNDKDKEKWNNIFCQQDFRHPVCFDADKISLLNHFPHNMVTQTFLLNKFNKIVAVGCPICDTKTQELYLEIIRNNYNNSTDSLNTILTKVSLDKPTLFLRNFK